MDSLGDRMKANYENRTRFCLTRRTPVILRLDGRAFHTLTKFCSKPFDLKFSDSMRRTTEALCSDIQGARFAYTQSDEISLLLTDFDNLTTEAWFDYNIQKVVSVSAGIASAQFSQEFGPRGVFDCRAFNIPEAEVANYFIWRQKDWIRNSVQMLGQAHFFHGQLQGKSLPDIHEMLHQEGVNWVDLPKRWKNGQMVYRDLVSDSWTSKDATIFTQSRLLIERYLNEGGSGCPRRKGRS